MITGDKVQIKDKRIKENGLIGYVTGVNIGTATIMLENDKEIVAKFKNIDFIERLAGEEVHETS